MIFIRLNTGNCKLQMENIFIHINKRNISLCMYSIDFNLKFIFLFLQIIGTRSKSNMWDPFHILYIHPPLKMINNGAPELWTPRNNP